MYKILNKDIPFTINSKTGDVCTAKVLDRELKENYEFAVSAEDGKFDAKVRSEGHMNALDKHRLPFSYVSSNSSVFAN